MILRNAERIDAILNHAPANYVLSGDIDAIPDDNIHRTFSDDICAIFCADCVKCIRATAVLKTLP